MKKVSGKIRLELAQFRELEAFMQFASDLDDDTKKRIDSGRKYVELLKQKQNDPMPFYKQVVSIYAANAGIFDSTTPEKVNAIETEFLEFVARDSADILSTLETGRELTDEVVAKLDKAIADYKEAHAQNYTI
jgi:F-type H+-transporting ATPase subunit alpha